MFDIVNVLSSPDAKGKVATSSTEVLDEIKFSVVVSFKDRVVVVQKCKFVRVRSKVLIIIVVLILFPWECRSYETILSSCKVRC